MKEIMNQLKDLVVSSIMNNKVKAVCILATFICILISITISVNHISLIIEYNELKERRTPIRTKNMEYAYMEGQVDYMTGDVRIKKTDSDYEYILSPWNGGSEPTYWKRSEYKKDIEWWKQ